MMYHGVNGSAEELHQRENRGPSYNPPLSRGMCHFSHRCRSMWRLRSRDTSRTPSRAEHASTGSFSRHSSSRSTTASPSARQRPRNGARPLQGKPLSVGSNNERRGEKSGGGGGVRLFYCRREPEASAQSVVCCGRRHRPNRSTRARSRSPRQRLQNGCKPLPDTR